MGALPYMMMNWTRFFSDPKVEALPAEAKGIYALVLGKMWLNEGWISADDKVLARILGLDVRRWRTLFKPLIVPLLRRDIVPHVGAIYTQKHLQEVRAYALATVEKTAASTARARAAKAAKHGFAPSVAEPEQQPEIEPVTEPAPASAAEPVARGKREQEKKGGPQPIMRPAVPPFLQSPQPKTNGAEHDIEAEPASDPALRRRLVSDGMKPRQPSTSLFGRLQAAKEEENDD
jgi:uncharacterized protein YdaU (DUF1376 family)